MPHKLIQSTSVKIQVKKDGNIIKKGTGVIVYFDNECYVLTAFHCVGTNENLEELPNINEIIIERQHHYNSSFEIIKPISIHKIGFEHDFILIKIEFIGNDSVRCGLGKNFMEEDIVKFCGYQGIYENEYRPFEGKIILISPETFRIKLVDDTFNQGGEDGSYIAEGLSGSGVYIIKNKKPYLIGILNSVKDEQAWNDDIECCPVNICLSQTNCNVEDLSDINHIKEWSENIEKEKTQEDIDNYKSLNVLFFENLLRKNIVIHDDEEKANLVTNRELKKYLSFRENISLLESQYPTLYIRFQNIVKRFQDDVEEVYTRSVGDNNDAKNIKIELKDKLKEELENILGSENIDNDVIKFDLADYQIIEWLLDCSLNFTKK